MEKFFDKSLELIDNTNNMNNMNNMNNENEEEKEEEEEITEIIQETKVENKYQWSTTSKSITNSNNSPKTTSTIPVPFVTSKLRPLSKNLVLSNKKPLSKTLKEFLPRAHNLKNTKQTNF